MKSARECKDRFEDLVALVMGELDPSAARELQVHIAVCDKCRADFDALAEEEKAVRSGFEAIARSLGPVERLAIEEHDRQSRVGVGVSNNRFLERVKNMILAHKRLIVAAAAAAAMAASVVLYVSIFSFSAPAYALEQTVEANSHVRSYHAKLSPAKELGEVWVELGPDGAPTRARWDLQSPDDGFKVIVFSEGKAEIWFKDKKAHVFVPEEDGLRMVMQQRSIFDPKLAFEQLQARIEAGKVQVETKEPTEAGKPVTLTVTSKKDANQRSVYEIDSTTKLVERTTQYRRRGDQWEQVVLIEYLDYNQEIDPAVFHLDLPEDVFTIDQINRKPGLVKGDLTDDAMATKVVREFFEALIAEDYEKAGLILGGMPAEELKKRLAETQIKFLRIVEVGEPASGPNPMMRALRVPVKVEVEENGNKGVQQFSPFVRAVYNQPDRWEICGGF